VQEMVIDEFQGQRQPRYLIYDIIRFEGEEVGKTNFGTRIFCIEKEIILTRQRYTEAVCLV
jgi:mRNA-capping enzyme